MAERAPFRWALCRQTVTLYHPDHDAGTVTRTLLHGVFFDARRRETLDGDGAEGSGSFLLIIPAGAEPFSLVPGDRVMEGEGPVLDYAGWADFSPANTPGVAAVQYVDRKTLRGIVTHTEAGGWWTSGGTGAHSLTN